MTRLHNTCKLPPERLNHEGKVRKVGIEIEMAGLTPLHIVAAVKRHFGGDESLQGSLEYGVLDTRLGDFTIELDSSPVKKAYQQACEMRLPSPLDDAGGIIKDLAENWVPWELVTPPVPVTQLDAINELVADLRDQGALGTHKAPQYAFGMHLNPDLPDLETSTILRHLQAYLCLYDGIVARERPNFARKLTPHIRHFDENYIRKVIADDYAPDLDTLIGDYVEHNPTRNRSLDLLPLFKHLREKTIVREMNDPRIKARPTFHFRLPNSDIDNPNWGIHIAWHEWLAVEWLAADEERLAQMCSAYSEELDRFGHHLDSQWEARAEEALSQ
ncbi:amidoligase family protein [Simiduia aestuariiviva]|uniref:Amidoligase enzyme n=1 Tax=Simiduia aestuariiviva TaxID=1510459 RepID=A0A839URU4_9GAMM|nr:amidoligase family protein [Simiduia aestuariiviva]MBB3169431.1 hypothetical protein [Simiduia aestuariiviva]